MLASFLYTDASEYRAKPVMSETGGFRIGAAKMQKDNASKRRAKPVMSETEGFRIGAAKM